MKKLLLLLLTGWSLAGLCQQTVTVRHLRYTTTYDTIQHYPTLVTWKITKRDVGCPVPVARTDDFRPDPAVGPSTAVQRYFDPIAQQYDRGHNMNADDNGCDRNQMSESFLFSNMTAQNRSLNRGVWRTVETYTQKLVKDYDTVKVWAGSVGHLSRSGAMVIPAYCWKIIRYGNKTEAYLFPNDASVLGKKKEKFKTTVAVLKSLTGLALDTM